MLDAPDEAPLLQHFLQTMDTCGSDLAAYARAHNAVTGHRPSGPVARWLDSQPTPPDVGGTMQLDGGVLLVGDSHLEFWDRASAALQPHAPVVNFGIAGATVADLAAWAERLVTAWGRRGRRGSS